MAFPDIGPVQVPKFQWFSWQLRYLNLLCLPVGVCLWARGLLQSPPHRNCCHFRCPRVCKTPCRVWDTYCQQEDRQVTLSHLKWHCLPLCGQWIEPSVWKPLLESIKIKAGVTGAERVIQLSSCWFPRLRWTELCFMLHWLDFCWVQQADEQLIHVCVPTCR